MKWIYTYILAMASCLTGCIREGIEPCPPSGNVTLTFRYLKEGQDLFPSAIRKVNLYLFLSGGSFIRSVEIPATALILFQGIRMDLPPGTYDIIGWANVEENSAISPLAGEEMTASYLYYTGTATGDSLYHSPGVNDPAGYELIVADTGSIHQEMDFTNRHKIVEVYIQGIGNNTVELAGLIPGYYFDMKPLAAPANSMEQPGREVNTPQGRAYLSQFYTPEFGNTNPIEVRITDPAGMVIHAFSLQDYITTFYPDLIIRDGGGETIRVLLRFNGTTVYVSLPPWTFEDVTPIY